MHEIFDIIFFFHGPCTHFFHENAKQKIATIRKPAVYLIPQSNLEQNRERESEKRCKETDLTTSFLYHLVNSISRCSAAVSGLFANFVCVRKCERLNFP